MKTFSFKTSFILMLIFVSASIFAQINLPPLFTNNMVLQQNSDAPIWGKSRANSKITITTSWNNREYTTHSDSEGNWQTTIETPSAGGPYEIKLKDKKTVTLKNVMIGEVWICSGQSNMEMPLSGWGKIIDFEKDIAEANYPNIRLMQVEKKTSPYPSDNFVAVGNGWQECSTNTIPEFSATAYFFGRELHEKLNVPIGLIHTSWGGTPAESWVSKESLVSIPEFVEKVEHFSQLPQDIEEQKIIVQFKLDEWNNKVLEKDFGLRDNIAVAAKPDYNATDWKSASLPGVWEQNGHEGFDGIVWYRKTIDIPKEWEGKNLLLSLGTIDDNDITYFNGVEVGRTNAYNAERKYSIPKKIVKSGKAVIAVRVMDTGGDGGFYDEASKMYIAPEKTDLTGIELSGNWAYKLSVDMKDVGPRPQLVSENPHNPTSLFNAMINPLLPYAIKGAIWYQGESNADRAYQYRRLFPLMISDWRSKWGYEFPFYFVQLANFMKIDEQPNESSWAELREAQLQTLHLQNTGMAVTIDIGDANDIHPKNKQDVGKRLAFQALKKTYGSDLVATGPIYKNYRIENGKIRIFFEESDSKLMIKGEKLTGFSVAGPDKKFYWAEAVIDGNEVVVSSTDVKFPVAVRYAWANNPVCNLYNEAGLPASPFRTDDFQGKTATSY